MVTPSSISARRWFVACALGWVTAGCALVVDTDALQEGCAADEKACPLPDSDLLVCVSDTLPQYGCGSDACHECALPNAEARCANSGSCSIAACKDAYSDCNGEGGDGCEVDTGRDEENCGACANACDGENAVMACSSGVCTVVLCLEGFGDCDGRASNGCETDVSADPSHCGGCDQPCAGTCANAICGGE